MELFTAVRAPLSLRDDAGRQRAAGEMTEEFPAGNPS